MTRSYIHNFHTWPFLIFNTFLIVEFKKKEEKDIHEEKKASI